MTQGKKRTKIDFEVAFIGISWTLILLMFAISLTSCDSSTPKTVEPVCNAEEVYCISRTSWYECTEDGWHKTGKALHYCENDIIYQGDLGACEGDEIIEYLCEVWACEGGDNFNLYEKTGTCDPESILP